MNCEDLQSFFSGFLVISFVLFVFIIVRMQWCYIIRVYPSFYNSFAKLIKFQRYIYSVSLCSPLDYSIMKTR